MAKTYEQELEDISKEIIESQKNSGQPFQSFDPVAELAKRKRREERLAKIEKETAVKKSKK